MKSKRKKTRLESVLIGILIVLLPVLGILQYVWLDRLSEGERLRLEAQAQRAAERFSEDFSRDFAQARAVFQIPVYDSNTDPEQALLYGFQQWNQLASMPSLIESVYWVECTRSGGAKLFHFDPEHGTLDPVKWSPELDEWKLTLEEQVHVGQGAVLRSTQRIDFDDQPVMVIPQVPIFQSARPDQLRGYHFVLLRLDPGFIQNTYIPELAGVHFEDDIFEFAVRRSQSTSGSFYQSNAALEASFFDEPDAQVPLSGDAVSGSMMRLSVMVDSSDGSVGTGFVNRILNGGNELKLELRTSQYSEFSFESSEPDRSFLNWDSLGHLGERAYRLMQSRSFPDTSNLGAVVIRREAGVSVVGIDHLRDRTGTHHTALAGPDWELVLNHRAGSIAEAVSREKWKNLGMGYSIMLILSASIFMLILGTRRAQRLAQQQMEFVAGVSHELRTPLAVIRSAGENLADGVVRDPTRMQRYGKLIRDEGRRLSHMVEQSMELAGIQAGQRVYRLRPIQMQDVLERACASVRVFFDEKNVTLEQTLLHTPIGINGDPAALQSALENLLHNAVKYSPTSGTVQVDVEQDAHSVLVSVKDEGIGIAADDIPHIFEPFYRGEKARSEQYEGSGIGLSLVNHVVEAHGGSISVQSRPGEGSTFTIHLPIQSDEQTNPAG